MGSFYAKEWRNFRQDYLRSFIWVFVISAAFSVFSYFALVNEPEAATQAIEQLMKAFEEKGLNEGMSNTNLFWLILKNNLFVSFIMVIVGLIPIVILPAISAVVTAITIGVLLAYSKLQGENIVELFVFGILPHGVLEIIGLLLTSSIGIFLSRSIAQKLFSRNRDRIYLRGAILQAGRSYLLLVVPFISIAAVIEGFITPLLIGLVR